MPSDTAVLEATLLGRARLAWGDRAIEARSRKGQALLFALCVRPEGLQRAELAELLWGVGRVQNVRQELTSLRALPGADEWLDPDDPVRLLVRSDVADFEAACAANRFEEALGLYRAPLLTGFELPRTPVFADWLETERQRLSDLHRHALRMRAQELEEAEKLEAAARLVDRLIELEPLDETAYRSAMRLAHRRGELGAALAYFSTCRRVLLDELGTEPLDETAELHARIVAAQEQAVQEREEFEGRMASVVGRLSGAALHLAQALALPGAALPVEALADVVEVTPGAVAATFEELVDAGLVERGALKPAARRAVRDVTPAALRAYLHGRAASALANAEGAPADVAAHFLAANEPSAAAGWLRNAAEAATAALDFERAERFLFRALWAQSEPRERTRLLLRLERHAMQTGAAELRAAALNRLEEEAFLLQDDEVLVEYRLARAAQLVQTGRAADGLEVAADAAACARRIGRVDFEMAAEHLTGAAAIHAGQLGRAHEAFEAVVRHGDPEKQLPALNNLGVLAGIQGDLDEAVRYQEQALTVARRLGARPTIAGVLNNLGATSERAADYERAARSFEEAARLYAAVEDPVGEATAWTNVADVRLKQRRADECAAALTRARRLAERLEAPALECRLLLVEGTLHQSLGEFGAAERALEQALKLASETGADRQLAVVRFNLEMTRLLASPEASDGPALEALERIEKMGVKDMLPWAYAELGAVAATPEAVRGWAEKLAAFATNPHLRLLRLELEQRARLLAGDDTPVPGLAELEAR